MEILLIVGMIFVRGGTGLVGGAFSSQCIPLDERLDFSIMEQEKFHCRNPMSYAIGTSTVFFA
uniref:Uncharacterized protein n=1 Tax=Moniliophthora roreri TaxID=221103 RepID=A0A0W0FPA7_MONRR